MICTIMETILMFNLSIGHTEKIEFIECIGNSQSYEVQVSKYRGYIVELEYDDKLFQMNVRDATGVLK